MLLKTHRKHYYRKVGECPKPKPRPKHPIKVYVWAGISKEGATEICIFAGVMNAEFYVCILQQYLIPFLQRNLLTRNTDLCKTTIPSMFHVELGRSNENHINWWCTPPKSPNLNPIENLWHIYSSRNTYEPKLNHRIRTSL